MAGPAKLNPRSPTTFDIVGSVGRTQNQFYDCNWLWQLTEQSQTSIVVQICSEHDKFVTGNKIKPPKCKHYKANYKQKPLQKLNSIDIFMECHLRATECHLPHGITQYYLPPNTSEHILP